MAPQFARISIEYDRQCTMRDGTILRSDIYRPVDDGPFPVLLVRLPYGKHGIFEHGMPAPTVMAQAGYIVVVQDVRGRYASEGRFEPSVNERDDGYDTVEWAAALAGSTGEVGTYGPSYLAEVQWSAALAQPPALRTIVPMVSPSHSNIDGFVMRGGARELGSRLGWVHLAIGLDTLVRSHSADPLGTDRALDEHQAVTDLLLSGALFSSAPFAELRTSEPFLHEGTTIFGDSLAMLSESPVRTAGRYDSVDLPIFLIGGWYDVFLGSTLAQYEGARAHAARAGQQPPHLVVGPWSHLSKDEILGEVSFGNRSTAAHIGHDGSLDDQHVRWFDAILKEQTDSLDAISPVRLFVMGSNRWVHYESYPPAAQPQHWHLAQNGELTTAESDTSSVVSYTYDPQNPAPTIGGATLIGSPAGPFDQRALYQRDDVLTFASEPLTDATTVIGRIDATLFASSSAVDTDFVMRLVDVHPDGRAINIADGIIRASARDCYDHEGATGRTGSSLIEPGTVYEYRFNLWATAHTFLAGHRIQVDLTSSSFPRWDANRNTGETFYTSVETQSAEQTVHLGGVTPSRITLPVVRISD